MVIEKTTIGSFSSSTTGGAAMLLDESDRALLDSIRNILTTGVLSYKLHIDLLDKLEDSTIEANRKHDDAMRLQISRMGGERVTPVKMPVFESFEAYATGERVYAEAGEIAGSKRDPNDW